MGRIERFTSRADAELARSVLEDAGIPAYVSGDDAGGVHPDIPFGIGGTAVVVPDDRQQEAERLLRRELRDDVLDDAELEAAALAAGGQDVVGAPATATLPADETAGGPGRVVRAVVAVALVLLLFLAASTVLDLLR
ncbi:putative signal transducing protein [Egicoccus sp. AB-alg2]|uniref:putative signal transducing protein n=1 Tax=Egicoccus sp. AB-alg2 TaxID=3242693 RepID=UPI00359D5FCC